MSRDDHPADAAEQAALYLAGALPAEERATFEAHLDAGCPDCAAELRELDAAVVDLAALVDPVSPDPKTRVALLARIAGQRQPAARRERSRETVQRADGATWRDTRVPGMQARLLYIDRRAGRYAALLRMAAGSRYPAHRHSGPEECLVLEGDMRDGDVVLRAGDFQYSPAGSDHGELSTDQGCLIYLCAPLADLPL